MQHPVLSPLAPEILSVGSFKGNIWAGDGKTKVNMAIFFDEKANEQQRKALNMIFSGKAGGFMAKFAKLIGEVSGIEYVPIKFELSDDLSYWSAKIPRKSLGKGRSINWAYNSTWQKSSNY